MAPVKRYLPGTLLIIVLLFVLPLAVNSMITLFLNRNYKSIDNAPSTEHYIIKKIASGQLEAYYPYRGFIDTLSGQNAFTKLNNNANASDDTTSASFVYFDTVKYQFKLQVSEFVNSKKKPEMYDQETHYLTLNHKGNILSDVRDSTEAVVNLKNCINLQNVIQPWQKWSDKSKLIYTTHFSEEHFKLPGLAFYPVDSSTPHCYWSGYGYYGMNKNNETLKFKVACRSRAVFWTTDDDLDTGLSLYMLPQHYRAKLDVTFLLTDSASRQNLYLVTRK